MLAKDADAAEVSVLGSKYVMYSWRMVQFGQSGVYNGVYSWYTIIIVDSFITKWQETLVLSFALDS